jgi:serine/threonine protein kinase
LSNDPTTLVSEARTSAGATEAEPRSATTGAPDLERGASVGRYVVLNRIGSGGMGVVYSAYDPELDRRVALKILGFSDPARPTRGNDRLLREAQAMARLSHPNVIAVHDVGEHDHRIFIAMEFVEGQTLTQWLESPRDWDAVVHTFLAAGEGLAAAHAKGLIHRDFKPDNVMMGDDGRVRVLDFGLVRTDDEPERHPLDESLTDAGAKRANLAGVRPGQELTVAGTVMGTPAYMAPEQILGAPTDARTDQFGFCIALYEGLYGERPFGGDTNAALALQVCEGNVRSAPADARVPSWLRRVLLRGLSTEPSDRYASIEELLTAIRTTEPSKKRSRAIWIAAVGAVAVVTTSLALAAAEPDEVPADPCLHVSDELHGVWSEEARGELNAAFENSALAYADTMAPRILQQLDTYVDSVAGAQARACRRSEVERTTSDELYDLQMECLARRTSAVGTAVEVLSEADDSALAEAHKVIESLPPADRCEDVDYLRSPIRPPEDPQTVERVATVREELERAKMLQASGQHKTAEELAAGLVNDARETSYPPVLAEALARHARLTAMMGDNDSALEMYRKAYLMARKLGHDELGMAIALDMTFVTGLLSQYDLAANWALIAKSDAERIDYEQGIINALMYEALVLHWRGHSERSLEVHEEAYQRMLALDPNNPRMTVLLNNRALPLLDLERWEEARAVYSDVAELVRSELGESHPQMGLSYLNLGVIAAGEGKNEDAIEYFDRVHLVWKDIYPPDHYRTGIVRHNRGASLFDLGRFDEARGELLAGTEIIAKAFGEPHPRLVDSFCVLARFHIAVEEFDEARVAIDRAHKSNIGGDERHDSKRSTILGIEAKLLAAQGRCGEGIRRLESNPSLASEASAAARSEALLELAEGMRACKTDEAQVLVHAHEAKSLAGDLDPADPVLVRAIDEFLAGTDQG